ncbi:hypothetical protein VQL36_19385 [Chengkuizengella sp. SCS-71B]|uniref:hypothetical protein n=1 Tax=Chengkuizengella sp. SCS-71B TaxID=3115290 RepID=UPI0032C24AA7
MKKILLLIFTLLLLVGCTVEESQEPQESHLEQPIIDSLEYHYSTTIYQYEKIIENIINNEGDSEYAKGMLDIFTMQNNLLIPTRIRDTQKSLTDDDFTALYNLYRNINLHANDLLNEDVNYTDDYIEKLNEVIKLTDDLRGLNPYKETILTIEKVKELNSILENIVDDSQG